MRHLAFLGKLRRFLSLPHRNNQPRSRSTFLPSAELLESLTLPCTINWINPASGTWGTAANWDLNRVPNSSDDACISVPADITVTHSSGASIVGSLMSQEAVALTGGILNIRMPSQLSGPLTISGGTLGGAGNITVNGISTWTGGTLSGTGQLRAAGGLTIDGAGQKFLDGRTLENAGTGVWRGSGNILAENGAVLHNLSSGVFVAETDATFAFTFGADPAEFRNSGTLRKTGAGGALRTRIESAFNNLATGRVEVQSGTLSLADGTSTGRFSVASGAMLNFSGGINVLQEESGVDGAGTVHISAEGTRTTFLGSYNVTGLTRISNGTATFNADANINNGELEAGILEGTGTLTASGAFAWTAGTMRGTGITQITETGTLTLDSPNDKVLTGRTLLNLGTARWRDTGNILVSNGAQIRNELGATFEALGNASTFLTEGSTTFHNLGSFVKSTGTGLTRFAAGVVFDNSGTVTVETGTLGLADGTSPGTFTVLEGATLDFAIRTHTLPEGSLVTGPGNVRVTGATVNVAGEYSITGETRVASGTLDSSTDLDLPTFTFTGGTFAGLGNLTVRGLFTWTAGTIEGTGGVVVAEEGQLAMGGVAFKILDTRNFDLYGGGTWDGSSVLALANNPTFTIHPTSLFDVLGDSVVGGDGNFVIDGSLTKSAGAGPLTFDQGVTFSNNNLLSVLTGRVSILGAFPNFADQTLTGGTFFIAGTLQFVNADLRTNAAAVTLSGAASAIVNQNNANALANFGTNLGYFGLENGRNFTTAAAFTNSGEIAVQTPSLFTATGLFSWTGGILSGTGTLQASAGLNLNSVDAVFLSGLTVNLGNPNTASTSTWNAGDLYAGDGARINLAANATLIIPIDANAYHSGSGDPVLLVNAGTVRRTVSANSATFWEGIGFTNTGTVVVENGTLALLGGLTNFDTATGVLTGGTYTLTGLLQFPRAAVVTNQADITLIGANAGIVDEVFANAFLTLATHAANRQLTLQNGALLTTEAATFINSGLITLGGAGTAFAATGDTLTITASGRLTLQSGANFSSAATTFTNNGQITLGNANTLLTVTGNVVTGGNGSALTINNGATLSAGTCTLSSSTATVAAGGTLSAAEVAVQGGTLNAPGTITAAVVLQNGTLTSAGTINGGVTQLGGTLNGSGTINGSVWLQVGTFNASGTINGNVLFQGGRINLGGNAVGTLTVNGDWTQEGGILQVQLRDENNYDRLVITGTATLGGTLEVRLLNSFDPPLEIPFDFLTFGGVLGEFSDLSPPADMVFRVDIGETGAALVRAE